MLTRRGVSRYRPRPDWQFVAYLLTEDNGHEREIEVTIHVDDWEDFTVNRVDCNGWDIGPLLKDDEWRQVDQAVRAHYTEMCERMADYEDERGDWLHDQRKDYLAESRGE